METHPLHDRLDALGRGWTVEAGLHEFLCNDEQFTAAALSYAYYAPLSVASLSPWSGPVGGADGHARGDSPPAHLTRSSS